MKNKLIIALLPVLLLSCGSDKEDTKAGPKGMPKLTVDVVKMTPGSVVRTISIPGSIIPSEEVQLYSEVSGRVQSISFKEGQTVKKGAVLLQVDTDVLKAQRAQLKVELDLAKKDEARKKILLNAKGISAEEYEKVASQLANIEAQIDLINVQISKATVRAPFSGRIGLRRVSEGAFISPSTLITSIVQENPIKIEFSISERYANAVKSGQTIHFKTDNGTTSYSATVYAFESMVDQGTRMLTVRATAPNTGKLIAGTFVSIDYDLGNEQNAYMVPAESIIPVLKGQVIYVVRGGMVTEVPVEIGIRTAKEVQVIGEFNQGDVVLVSGLLAVRPGMPVNTKIVEP